MLEDLDAEVVALYRQGCYPRAVEVAEKSIRIATQTFGAQHAYVQSARDNLRAIQKAQDKLVSAEESVVHKGKPLGLVLVFSPRALALVLVALLFLVLVVFIDPPSMLASNKAGVSAAPVQGDANSFPHYRVRAHFYPEQQLVKGEEEVVFELVDPRQQVVFNLYLNRHQNQVLNSSEVRRYALQRGMDPGSITIKGVSSGDRRVSFREEGELLIITPEEGVFEAGEHRLTIEFQVKIPLAADRVGGNEKGIWLGNWLPTLAVTADPGGYKPTEIGDPYVNISSNYEVWFTIPREYDLVLSNTAVVEEWQNTRVYAGTLERVRDLPVFLNRSYKEAVTSEGAVEIRYYYLSGNSREVLRAAKEAVAFYTATVGPYPWRQLNIVENDMYLSGMEYATLVLVSSRVAQHNPVGTVYHEVGHQWFYNIVGSDQYRHPFLDEGLVEFLTKYALGDQVPRYWPNLPDLDRPLGEFNSWQQYRAVHYVGGEKLFANLCYSLGEKSFADFLREYYQRYQYQLVTLDQFKEFVFEQTGQPFDQL